MKVILLAGGYAKRLWPLTKDIAKPMIDVGGSPVILRIIRKLEPLDEVDGIIISTNKKFEPDFRNFIQSTSFKKNIELVVEDADSDDKKLGAIGGINYVIKKARINDECLIIAGDNLFDFDLSDFIRFCHLRECPVLAAYDIKNRDRAKLYGLVKVDSENKIVDFFEKPDNPETTLVSTGCYYFPKSRIKMFSKYLSGGNHSDNPGYFIQWLHKINDIYAYIFDGAWFDIGDEESLKRARIFFQ